MASNHTMLLADHTGAAETEFMAASTIEVKEDQRGDGSLDERNLHLLAGERDEWSKKREYFLSVMGYIVGIGNLWRFPYMCNRNGGGAFLLPFLFCLLVFGLPLFFLESALGQFTGKSPVHVWSVCPLVKGAGIAMSIMSAIYFWYYNVLLAWTLYYLVSSFQSTVPWSLCGQWWNTPSCTNHAGLPNTSTLSSVNWTGPYADVNVTNHIATVFGNSSSLRSTKPVTAAEEFWQHNVLQMSSGLYESGHLVWRLAVAQCVVVLMIFLALLKGIKSSGKVVYVTAIAPYLLLPVLLVRGATLPGAREGILFYLTPDFNRLLEPQVWVEATLHVFYSLGVAWGGIITMASYNKFSNNCMRDAVILSLLGEGTSIFGGFAIFSVLGYMADQTGLLINQVVSSGPGLVFIVYPEAISLMPVPQLWAVLFFLMVVTLVIDSQMATGETVLTVLCDNFPHVLGHRRVLLTGSLSALILLTSLGFVTQGGIYLFQLFDWFNGTYTVIITALIECVVLAWIYGADHFGEDVRLMIGRKPPLIFRILWCFIIPFMLVILLIFTLIKYEAPSIGTYHYDTWANVIGWMIATVSFIPIPVVALYQLLKAKGSLAQRLKQTTRPNDGWFPSDPAKRKLYLKQLKHRPLRRNWLDVIR